MDFPVELTDHHVHLSQEAVEALFGEGHQLTVKETHSTGDFEAVEVVTLIGPKGTIADMPVLGPVRTYNLAELLKCDYDKMGVKAPVEYTAQTENAATLTIEGSKGRLTLDHFGIITSRHLHLDAENAEKLKLSEGDFIKVRSYGKRALVYENVLVRVTENPKNLFHLDVEEGNAADLSNGDMVTVVL